MGQTWERILKAYNILAAVAAQWLSARLPRKTLEVVGSVPPGYWLFSYICILQQCVLNQVRQGGGALLFFLYKKWMLSCAACGETDLGLNAYNT